MSAESAVDDLDRQVIRCLELAARAPFATIADVLAVSEQTVARRYRRLVRDGLLRVTGVLDPVALGQSNWIVRIRCRPSGASSLARALAQRDDVSWVTIVSGGAEVVCVLRARTSDARDELLMERLPRSTPVLDMETAMVLHRFIGGGTSEHHDWSGLGHTLSAGQEQAISAADDLPVPAPAGTIAIDDADQVLLAELARDGRATFARLGTVSGLGEARAARRFRTLVESGALYLDIDVNATVLDRATGANLWLSTAPADLERVGRALADEASVPFAAAVTGRMNLTATVLCPDVVGLYTFVTDRIGRIPGITSLELAPVLRHVKQAGARIADGRFTA